MPTGICTPTSSDLAGAPQNLIDRVKRLEEQMAEILAGNTKINQISDLSTQVGWVGGVTFMGQDGWTQTEAGTLIPPAGVTLSSLGLNLTDIGGSANTQFVVMDANGNLIFGADALGNLSGSLSTAPDYLRYSLLYSGANASRNITINFNTFEITEGVINSSLWAEVTHAGLYLITAFASFGRTSGPTPSSTAFAGQIDIEKTPGIIQAQRGYNISALNTIFSQDVEPATAEIVDVNCCGMILANAGDQIITTAQCIAYPSANMPANMKFGNAQISIVELVRL